MEAAFYSRDFESQPFFQVEGLPKLLAQEFVPPLLSSLSSRSLTLFPSRSFFPSRISKIRRKNYMHDPLALAVMKPYKSKDPGLFGDGRSHRLIW